MSLLPYFFDDFGLRRPRRLLDQHFGLAITPDDLLTSVVAPSLSPVYCRPWRHLAGARDIGATIKADKDQLQIIVDVAHFAPEEITVKTADGCVVVEGRHEERRDEHGLVARAFSRRYALPPGVAAEDVRAQLAADGVLTVTAPRRARDERAPRDVPIARTGPVRKEVKDVGAEDKKEEPKEEDKDKKEEEKK